MIHTLKSKALTVQINEMGAAIWSIKTADGTEYLWQGDPKYWDEKSLNLFPQIGLCTNGVYTLHGKTYEMPAHGFVCSTMLKVAEQTENSLTLYCEDTEETRKAYPFSFRYAITYTVEGSSIYVKYTVENHSDEEMYFAIGGHPGFNLPLEEGRKYEDYRLQFPAGSTAKQTWCTPVDCIMLDEITDYQFENDAIPLSHELFAERVLILVDMPKEVTLLAEGGTREVTVRYPDMKYLGVWKALGTDAPYVCIEPWTGVPARQNIVEDYELNPDSVHLAAGAVYENNWSIDIK